MLDFPSTCDFLIERVLPRRFDCEHQIMRCPCADIQSNGLATSPGGYYGLENSSVGRSCRYMRPFAGYCKGFSFQCRLWHQHITGIWSFAVFFFYSYFLFCLCTGTHQYVFIYIYTLSTIRGRVNPQWLEGFLEQLSCSQRVKVLTSALHTSNDTGDMNPGHGATKSLVQRGYPNPRHGKGTSWLTRYV